MTDKSIYSRMGPWRTGPPHRPLQDGAQPFPIQFVFPSGRQLLSHVLHLAGLARSDRVAFPEWSSHCVVSAIARYATPIPLNESLKYRIKTDAILIYEQWGWPVPVPALEELQADSRYPVLILDMVDSAHFKPACAGDHEKTGISYRFTSLSKILGLSGGGMGVAKGNYISFIPDEGSEKLRVVLEKKKLQEQDPAFIRNIMKDTIAALPRTVTAWIQKNDLWGAIEEERRLRQRNLGEIMNSPLADSWPSWMGDALGRGAGPGIAPLLRGADNNLLLKTKDTLRRTNRLETEIYHFNWSGNPLNPVYEKCLAIPVHGMVTDMESILKDIRKKCF